MRKKKKAKIMSKEEKRGGKGDVTAAQGGKKDDP